MIIEINEGELIPNDFPDVNFGDIEDFVGGPLRMIPIVRAVEDLPVAACFHASPGRLPWNFEIPDVTWVRGPAVLIGLTPDGNIRMLERREWKAYKLVDLPARALPILVVEPRG